MKFEVIVLKVLEVEDEVVEVLGVGDVEWRGLIRRVWCVI